VTNIRARWALGGLGTLAVFALIACSSHKNILVPSAHETQMQNHVSAMKQKQTDASRKAEALTRLKLAYKAVLKRTTQDQKLIPQILSQSDDALRKAQQFKTPEPKAKQPKEPKEKLAQSPNQKKLQDAQKLADEKAALLVATRRDLYANFDKAASLQKQIQTVTAQKEAADRGVKLEAIAIQHLKQSTAAQTVGTTGQVNGSSVAAQNHNAQKTGHPSRIAGNGRGANHL
jgi:hypothetical protein